MSGGAEALAAAARRLERWMLDDALPLWWARGVDHDGGGWRDQIAQDGAALRVDRRCRVQGRQTYVYALAGRMGWNGPWREAARHGLDYLDLAFRRPDGLYRTRVTDAGAIADDSALLYDQAFLLFALASAQAAKVVEGGLEPQAQALLGAVRAAFGYEGGGFRESGEAAFVSNPHMHLFEAAMAWEDAGAGSGWAALADEVAELCLSRFIDADTGALREFFDARWRPAAGVSGRIVEPGHQFEWAWLMERWGARRGRDDARRAAHRLLQIGVTHGVDAARGVAVNALLDDFSVHDPVARLWPQTERMKAAVAVAQAAEDPVERDGLLGEAARAASGLELYLATPVRGLWFDRIRADGHAVQEPAPASSFYHIACAIAEIQSAAAAT